MNVILGSKLNSDVISHIRTFLRPSPKQVMKKVMTEINAFSNDAWESAFIELNCEHYYIIEGVNNDTELLPTDIRTQFEDNVICLFRQQILDN